MKLDMPDKPSLDGLEEKWGERWESEGTYRFHGDRDADEVFAIDTPPPTVSGSLHVGHVFSYTHTDCVARFQRMSGKDVFYPMGWDDNGLPTERRVQNFFGVQCDPSLPYVENYVPEPYTGKRKKRKRLIPVSRRNFIELCLQLTEEDEKAFEDLWRRLSLSVDWGHTYTTIGEISRRVSQRAFLRLLSRDLVHQVEAPTLWDVDYTTAVAQAEIEDRERPGAYHRLRFGPVEIETTRPELLPACVALVAHPDDERYQPYFGKEVTTPLFGARVPVKPHELADPEKGTGIAMICTFGDTTDIIWWRELGLPVRPILGRTGRLLPVTWGEPGWECEDPAAAQQAYDEIADLPVKRAQVRIVELLAESGEMIDEPRPIQHAVKFYEKGDRPLEVVTSRQWFVKTLAYRDELLARGDELNWFPAHMQERYRAWVEGLNSDWCISRQRYFGVPIPVWYPVRDDGSVNYDAPIAPAEDTLPVDPSSDSPPGYSEAQRGEPGGFVGDPDVMDTWATSSLSPQIAGRWEEDPELFAKVFPMDLRPQAHEIIRTWLFSTVVRAHFEHDSLPWKNAAISGWVLDPDRKKMSKSVGNVVTPIGMLDSFGADAVRYWAASARLGVDTAFEEGQIKVGRRLAIKLLNAARFVLSRLGEEGEVTNALDRSMLAELARVVEESTAALEGFDQGRALSRVESFFWNYCDNYVELVKNRAYGNAGEAEAASANKALTTSLSVILRLFAPHLPYVSEEVWSWWQEGSVHRAAWPQADELRSLAGDGDPLVLSAASDALGEIRKAKTLAKVSLRNDVAQAIVRDRPDRLSALTQAQADLQAAGRAAELLTEEAEELSVEVTLAAESGGES